MNFLDKIIEYKKLEVEQQKELCNKTEVELLDECLKLPKCKSFIERISNGNKNHKMSLIAEIKKSSPSKGIIREDFNPVEIANDYTKSNVSAISVLTDEKFFQGNFDYLQQVLKVTNVPVLRKDFIIDSFQIYQTRLMGADLMLLIVSALTEEELKVYFELAKKIGLEVLVETHDKKEFELAVSIGAKLIGINNRNLSTFETSIKNTIKIIDGRSYEDIYIISESGINSFEDVVMLKQAGVSGILVGESLMRKDDIPQAIVDLLKDYK